MILTKLLSAIPCFYWGRGGAVIGREKVKSYVVLNKLFDVIGGFPNTGPERSSPIRIWQRLIEVHGLFPESCV